MVLVVQHLVFRSGDVNRLVRNLLSQVENAAVCSLIDFPVECQFEVLELLVGENDIASVLGTGFAHARLVDLDAAVFDGPCRGHVGTVVAAPSVERFAVEDGNEAFFYIGSLGCGRAVGRGFLIRIRYAGSCHCGNGHATDSTH